MTIFTIPALGQNLYRRNLGCNMKHLQIRTSLCSQDTFQVVCRPAGYIHTFGISNPASSFPPFFTPATSHWVYGHGWALIGMLVCETPSNV
jgi:hypothetical protein